MLPLFEGGEEGQEFAFVGGVVVLGWGEHFGQTPNEIVPSGLVLLVESRSQGMAARTKIEVELELGVEAVYVTLSRVACFRPLTATNSRPIRT